MGAVVFLLSRPIMELSVKADFKKLQKQLDEIGKKQLPFAFSRAMNEAGIKIKDLKKKELERQIDKPKPFTVNAVFNTRTNKNAVRNNNAVVIIGLKDKVSSGTAAATYLESLIGGGRRKPKPYERKLSAKGIIPRRSIITFANAKGNNKNKFGNISKARINKITDGLIAGGKDAKFVYAKGPGLIFQKLKPGRAGRRVVAFVRPTAQYTRQLDLIKPARVFVNRNFNRILERELRAAIMSATRR